MIYLSSELPFARGGNRLVFIDPTNPSRCIKVRRPDFSLEDMRRKKGFPHTLLPASRLDESVREDVILTKCEARHGKSIYRVLSRHYGFVETDMGRGLCSELIRNDNGSISYSVMEYVWRYGVTEPLEQAIQRFAKDWLPLLIPTRDILPHNVVTQMASDGNIKRLVVIDGLGFSGLIPDGWKSQNYKIRRMTRKLENFRSRVYKVQEAKSSGQPIDMFWQQRHNGQASPSNQPPGSN